jgi:hypothetical protein
MKVTSNPLNGVNLGGASPSAHTPRNQPSSAPAPQSELSLSAASHAVFAGRPERITELQNNVATGTYVPDSQKTSAKLVSEALSRPA